MRRDEQLSALMDDELSKDELRFLLKGLETDSEGRDKWGRYHAIGDALRDEAPASLDVDLSAAVMAEIEATEKATQQSNAQEPAWVKRVVSFAVAASVATVAVFVANDRGLIGSEPGLAINAGTPAAVASAPAARESQVADWQQVAPDVQERINRYLGTESNNAADPAIAPPVQLVGHRQELEDEAENAEAETQSPAQANDTP